VVDAIQILVVIVIVSVVAVLWSGKDPIKKLALSSFRPCGCLSVRVSLCLCICICLSVCLCICLSVCLSVIGVLWSGKDPTRKLALSRVKPSLSVCLSVYLSVCVFVCLSVCLSICLCVSVLGVLWSGKGPVRKLALSSVCSRHQAVVRSLSQHWWSNEDYQVGISSAALAWEFYCVWIMMSTSQHWYSKSHINDTELVPVSGPWIPGVSN